MRKTKPDNYATVLVLGRQKKKKIRRAIRQKMRKRKTIRQKFENLRQKQLNTRK